MKRVFLAALLLCVVAVSQTVTANNVVTNTLTILPAGAPAAATVTLIQSQPGTATYYYWLVSTNAVGSVLAGPFPIANAPATLSASANIAAFWEPEPGTAYSLLRTNTTATPNGACNCAVSVSSQSSYVTDTGSLSAYAVPSLITPSTIGPGPNITPTSIEGVEYADQFSGSDMGAKINAAALACRYSCTVMVPAGTYIITTPITSNPTQTLASPTMGLTIAGEGQSWQYDTPQGQVVLEAASGFAGASLMNLQYSNAITVRNITIACTTGTSPAAFDGIEFGNPLETSTLTGLTLDNVSVYGCDHGLQVKSATISRISGSQFTNNDYGLYFAAFSGDSIISDTYVNSNQTLHVPSAYNDFIGSGIFFGTGSNNSSVIGGKIEWNAYGVVIYQSQGIHVSGVQFDTNYVHSVYVLEDTPSDVASQNPRSISFVGCRFLGGGNQTSGTGDFIGSGVVVDEKQTGNKMDVLLAGNTFREAGTAAFDGNMTAPVGPSENAIAAIAPATGEVNVTVSGNDLNLSAGTNAVTAFDSVVQYAGNIGNLPLNNSGGSTFENVEAAPVTLAAGATLSPGQTLTATGATWTGGTVNASLLEQSGVAVPFPLSGSVTGATTNIPANSCGDQVTATIPGATTFMVAIAGITGSYPTTGLVMQTAITAANTVSVEYCNVTAAPIVPGAATINVRVIP